MRFSVPRSLSPSPQRKPKRHSRSTFRAPSSDSSSDDDFDHLPSGSEPSDSDASSEFDSEISAGSSSTRSYDSSGEDSDGPEKLSYSLPRNSRRSNRPGKRVVLSDTDKELEETLLSIRSRIQHIDLYDAWERQTRKDAFHIARVHHNQTLTSLRSSINTKHDVSKQSLSQARAADRADLSRRVSELEQKRQTEDRKLRDAWRERERRLWDRVEKSIKGEEERLKARLEAEKKDREVRERARLAEEQRRKDEEERRRKEVEAKRLKVEAEQKKKDDDERIARDQKNAREQVKAEQQADQELRRSLGALPSDNLWIQGQRSLKTLKTVTMRAIKGPRPPDPEPPGYQSPPAPPIKKLWNAQRRKITPKVGQLTDDPAEIARITADLRAAVAPIPGVPEVDQQNLHHALLSSVSKAILSQAETEVTANKAAARPLAQVAVALIAVYPLLGEIFWARMIGRIGVWAVGGVDGKLIDVDGMTGERQQLDSKEKMKRWGMRKDEQSEAHVGRVAGVLRLYFEMLFVEAQGVNAGEVQLLPQYRPARLWLYLAQLINHEVLLKRAAAPEAIYVALDSAGSRALGLWGSQFVKILKVVYDGVNAEKEVWGGPDVAAQASRARCLLEVEKILST